MVTEVEEDVQEVIWVRPSSTVQGVGFQVVKALETHSRVTLRAIGAGAVNQAVKGAINARQRLSSQGEDMILRPGIVTVTDDSGKESTAIVLHCMCPTLLLYVRSSDG